MTTIKPSCVSGIFTALTIIIIAAYCLFTVNRNYVYRDEVMLWKDAVKKSSMKDRPHNNLGLAYKNNKMFSEAVREYEMALKINPDYPQALTNLGSIYFLNGIYDKAVEYYEAAVIFATDSFEVHNNLGAAYHVTGRGFDALRHYDIAISLNPDFQAAISNREKILKEMEKSKGKNSQGGKNASPF